jgi:hypothetical protein
VVIVWEEDGVVPAASGHLEALDEELTMVPRRAAHRTKTIP